MKKKVSFCLCNTEDQVYKYGAEQWSSIYNPHDESKDKYLAMDDHYLTVSFQNMF